MGAGHVNWHVLFIIRRCFLQEEVQSRSPKIMELGISVGTWTRPVTAVRERIELSVCGLAAMKP